MSLTAPEDAFLDVNDAHLRVYGNVHADGLKLGQLEVVTTTSTGSTINFLHQHTAFTTTSNIDVGTTNHDLFVDTNLSRVGILTNTPTTALDVNGTVTATAFAGNGANLTGIPSSAINGTLSQWTTVTGPKIHYSDGNVGVGVADPAFKLDVDGDINFTGTLREDGNPFVSTPWTIESGPTALSYTGGNVGIGAGTPSAKLEVTGNAHVSTDLSVGGNLTINTISAAATHGLGAVTALSNTTSQTVQFTNTGTSLVTSGILSIGDHILPTQHEQFDIGSAEAKIRHMFLSDNSLWIGDEAKLSFTGNQLKFRRRKKNAVPRGLVAIGAAQDPQLNESTLQTNALAHANKSSVGDMKLEHWLAYAKTLDATKELSDVFTNQDADYDATSASEAFKEIGNEIFSTHKLRLGSSVAPTATLDITGTAKVSGDVTVDTDTFHIDTTNNRVLIGTTTPYYSQRFEVYGGNSRFSGGVYSRSQSKRFNYNFSTSGNNNHTLTIPINGASARGIMKLKINVVQVAPNSSSAGIAELEGYISAYGGTHGIIPTRAIDNSLYAEHICSSSTSSSGNLKIYYQPNEGYQQSVYVAFDIELQLGATFANAGSLSHALSSSNTGVTQTSPYIIINTNGRGGIGTPDPEARFTIRQSDGRYEDSNGSGLRFIQPQQTNRWDLGVVAHNDTNFAFAYNGGAKGYINSTAANAQLNFTGQHRTFVKDTPFTETENFEGLIVSADQNKYIKMSGGIEAGSNAITITESLPVVSLSVTAKDKKCFGVVSTSEDPEERKEEYGNFISILEKEKGDTRVYINSVGEGAIWVTNINGPLESGDYITTSNVAGYGQKQDSEFLANYTVAKITMDCDFDPVTQPVQVIKKDEDGENILDEHDQIQWEDDPSGATEKAYKIRYLDADGNITDEANAVHTAAFVGCTYHCG